MFCHGVSDCAARRLHDVASTVAGAAPPAAGWARPAMNGNPTLPADVERYAEATRRHGSMFGDGRSFTLLGQRRGRRCYEGSGGYTPSNKELKLTNLSAAPRRDGSAASCARGQTDGRTGSQLNSSVMRTILE
jgi:hypothetical protein